MSSVSARGVATESQGKKVALRCLVEALDASGQPRKAIAAELGITEVTLSKMTGGLQAFALDLLDGLPLTVVTDWLKRWGKQQGFSVELLDTDKRLRELIALFEQGASELVLLQKQREMRAEKEGRSKSA